MQTVDLVRLKGARDQMWAEAYVAYKNNETWWMDSVALRKEQAALAQERRHEDSRMSAVADFLVDKEWTKTSIIVEVVLRDRGGSENQRSMETAAGRILIVLGWQRVYCKGPLSTEMLPRSNYYAPPSVGKDSLVQYIGRCAPVEGRGPIG
jgi:predicted P-loop ATPase